jgi:hypothetical protein
MIPPCSYPYSFQKERNKVELTDLLCVQWHSVYMWCQSDRFHVLSAAINLVAHESGWVSCHVSYASDTLNWGGITDKSTKRGERRKISRMLTDLYTNECRSKKDKCPTRPMKTAVKSAGGVGGTIKASWLADIQRKRRRQVDPCLWICRHTRPTVLRTGMYYRREKGEVWIWIARRRNEQLNDCEPDESESGIL